MSAYMRSNYALLHPVRQPDTDDRIRSLRTAAYSAAGPAAAGLRDRFSDDESLAAVLRATREAMLAALPDAEREASL